MSERRGNVFSKKCKFIGTSVEDMQRFNFYVFKWSWSVQGGDTTNVYSHTKNRCLILQIAFIIHTWNKSPCTVARNTELQWVFWRHQCFLRWNLANATAIYIIYKIGNPLILMWSYILHHSNEKSLNLKSKIETGETARSTALYLRELDMFMTEFS